MNIDDPVPFIVFTERLDRLTLFYKGMLEYLDPKQ